VIVLMGRNGETQRRPIDVGEAVNHAHVPGSVDREQAARLVRSYEPTVLNDGLRHLGVNPHERGIVTKRGSSPVEILRPHDDTYSVVGIEPWVEATLVVGDDNGIYALSEEPSASHLRVPASEVDPHGLKISHVPSGGGDVWHILLTRG
jgi:hypothetical protein